MDEQFIIAEFQSRVHNYYDWMDKKFYWKCNFLIKPLVESFESTSQTLPSDERNKIKFY